MLKITYAHYEALRTHGEETYPHECCGVLLGRAGGEGNEVLELVRADNTRTDSLHNRYNIAPESSSPSSARRASWAWILWGSTTRIPTIRRCGRRPILPRRTGPAVRMSSPAWKKARRRLQIRFC